MAHAQIHCCPATKLTTKCSNKNYACSGLLLIQNLWVKFCTVDEAFRDCAIFVHSYIANTGLHELHVLSTCMYFMPTYTTSVHLQSWYARFSFNVPTNWTKGASTNNYNSPWTNTIPLWYTHRLSELTYSSFLVFPTGLPCPSFRTCTDTHNAFVHNGD